MIETINVNKYFADLAALKEVTLSVNKGSIYGLVGANGAGKTTLLKLLAGIYKQDSGTITIDSSPVFENTEVKSKTVFIPDHLYYFGNYTIQDMSDFYSRVYPTWNQERFANLQEVFNMEVTRPIKTLSKGMQRQVSFWLGFAMMPEVMILDEPLDGLDPVMRQRVKNRIVQDVADREMTVIISSHNLYELEDVSDHIGILHQGKMLIERDLDDLKADFHKIQVAFSAETTDDFYTDIRPLFREQRGSVHIMIMRGDRQEIISRIKAHRPAILDILPLTLEEIFIHEMGDSGYELQNIIY